MEEVLWRKRHLRIVLKGRKDEKGKKTEIWSTIQKSFKNKRKAKKWLRND